MLWYETNEAEGTGLELKPKDNEVTPLDLGSRIHEMLEEYYQELGLFKVPIKAYPESPNAALEIEAQMIMAAYKAKYPQEAFEIVDVERTFKVQLPSLCPQCYQLGGVDSYDEMLKMQWMYCPECHCSYIGNRHIYTGKIDVTFRENGKLNIMDHKTQKPTAASNHPKKWAARDQASLYLWAASKIYNEEIGNFYVNILQRAKEKKVMEGPVFPERQRLERTKEQIEIAVRDIVFIADEIERYKEIFGNNLWPSNREECTKGSWGDCEFYLPHTFGWDPLIREQKYQAKQPYLNLEGVQIIQP